LRCSGFVSGNVRSGHIHCCAECGAYWLSDDEERWQAHLGSDDLDEPAELAFYCPECAEREFKS